MIERILYALARLAYSRYELGIFGDGRHLLKKHPKNCIPKADAPVDMANGLEHVAGDSGHGVDRDKFRSGSDRGNIGLDEN